MKLAPGYGTRDAKWLRAIVAPAYQGQNGPEQGVEPDESNQDANSVLGDFVTCKKEEEQVYVMGSFCHNSSNRRMVATNTTRLLLQFPNVLYS